MFPEPRSLQLSVRTVVDRTPRTREISLMSADLVGFSWLPGQDISLGFSTAGGIVRRRYSIRRVDHGAGSLDINVVMHGDGPGMRWAKQARPGMTIEGIAPRGKITVAPEADWHLFAGDATAVPAALAMMEALPETVPVLGFFLVDDRTEQQAVPGSRPIRAVEWRFRDEDFRDALRRADLPNGSGHAYVAGEVALVSGLKADLQARGWDAGTISAKAYWNRGRANAGHGEPEQKAS